jgi:tRNA(Ile)-lysidine synthase
MNFGFLRGLCVKNRLHAKFAKFRKRKPKSHLWLFYGYNLVMHRFVRELITEWRRLRMPMQDATLVVAVSGGADSLALLVALEELYRTKKLKNRFIAAHFNHRLRAEESDADEEFVRNLTGERKIELAVGHADLSHTGNLEQNARVARYAFLRKTAENVAAAAVATAHTQNDQAETFLMNLVRGSGPKGLGGIRPIREMNDSGTPGIEGAAGQIGDGTRDSGIGIGDRPPDSPLLPFGQPPLLLVRPLVNWARRHDTEGYCRDGDVDFRYDSMNEDLNFTRVRVRKLLLPMLEEFNPKIVETLSQTARLMQYKADSEQSPEPDEIQESPDELSLKELVNLEKPELYSTLRAWLKLKRGDLRQLELKHIEAIERLVQSRKSGRVVELPNGQTVVKRGGRLVYADLKVEKSRSGN